VGAGVLDAVLRAARRGSGKIALSSSVMVVVDGRSVRTEWLPEAAADAETD